MEAFNLKVFSLKNLEVKIKVVAPTRQATSTKVYLVTYGVI